MVSLLCYADIAPWLANLPVAADENASVENRWRHLRDTVQSTALAVPGHARRQHQDWFNNNDTAISNLLAHKDRLHKAYVIRPTDDNKAAFYRSCRLLQQRLRGIQDAWTARKAEEIQVETDANLDHPPSLHVTTRAVQHLSSDKALGSDAIFAEIYKHGGPPTHGSSDGTLSGDVVSRRSHQDFKDVTIVHLYKRRENRQIRENHQGITLLNISEKIFARILLNRLNNHLEQGHPSESQCGFRRHRGTTDMIFAARQLQKKKNDW
ncbi:hypothetical protein SprV_0501895600 [Sparganum proliferum]